LKHNWVVIFEATSLTLLARGARIETIDGTFNCQGNGAPRERGADRISQAPVTNPSPVPVAAAKSSIEFSRPGGFIARTVIRRL
jgi:hypothetical protein